MTAKSMQTTAQEDRNRFTAEMIETWRRNIRVDTLARYHFEMGVAMMAAGDAEPAAAAFARAVDIKPDFFIAWLYRRQAEQAAGQAELAAQTDRRAGALRPDYEMAAHWGHGLMLLERGDYEDALSAFERAFALAENPSADADAVLEELIRSLLFVMKFDAALTAAQRLVDRTGGSGPALYLRAEAQFRLGRMQDALGSLTDAVDRHPPSADALRLLMAVNMALRRYNEMADIYRQLLPLINPDDAWSDQCTLGMALQAAGRIDEALEAYQAAAQNRRAETLAYLAQGLCGAGRYQDALTVVDEGLALTPGQWLAQSVRGVVLLRLGRPVEALAQLRNALRNAPDRAMANIGAGLALEALGRETEALAAYRQAAVEQPNWVWLHIAMHPSEQPRLFDILASYGFSPH
jgi:tetratricopeptide (TPR) repeat protein